MAENEENFGFIADEPVKAAEEENFGFVADTKKPEKEDTFGSLEPIDMEAFKPAPEPVEVKSPEVGIGEAFGRGASQGATAGFQEELSAPVEKFTAWLDQKLGGRLAALGKGDLDKVVSGMSEPELEALSKTYANKSYKDLRDDYRKQNAAAKAAHPYIYGTGEVAGSVLPTVATGVGAMAGGAKTMAQAAVQAAKAGAIYGGVSALGLSDEDLAGALEDVSQGKYGEAAKKTWEAAKDVGTGAALGGAFSAIFGGLGHKISKRIKYRRTPTKETTNRLVDEARQQATARKEAVLAKKATAESAEELADAFDNQAKNVFSARKKILETYEGSSMSPERVRAKMREGLNAADALGLKTLRTRGEDPVDMFAGIGLEAMEARPMITKSGELINKPLIGKGALTPKNIFQRAQGIEKWAENIMADQYSQHGRLLKALSIDDYFDDLARAQKNIHLTGAAGTVKPDIRSQLVFKPQDFIDKIEREALTLTQNEIGGEKALISLTKLMKDALGDQKYLSLNNLGRLKNGLKQFGYGAKANNDAIKYNLARHLERRLAGEIDRIINVAKDPRVIRELYSKGLMNDNVVKALSRMNPKAYNQALKNFALAATAKTGLNKKLREELFSEGFKLQDVISGYVAGAMTGSPLIGITAGVGQALISRRLNPLQALSWRWWANKGAQSRVINNPKLPKTARQALEAASQRGSKSLAATHLILSQQSPEYRNIVQKEAEAAEKESNE